MKGQFVETNLTPDQLARQVVAKDGRFMFSRLAYSRVLNAFEYTYTKCSRCGDERMAQESVIEQEIAHALKGCNGSLSQIDPTEFR